MAEEYKYTKDLEIMDQRLEIVEEKIDIIGASVKEIKDCLIGNEFTKNKGFVDELREIKRLVYLHEEAFKRHRYLIGLMTAIGSVIGFLLELFFSYLFKK